MPYPHPKSRTILEFLSFRDALAELYDIINTLTSGDVTAERYSDIKQEFENYVIERTFRSHKKCL